jgi:hypothetical protein
MASIKGALVQYGKSFLGPIPNIVIFQYNPEELSRSFEIQRKAPDDNAPARQREPSTTSAPPVETFTLNLRFDAADDLNEESSIAQQFGVGPQLAALEQMAYPTQGLISGAIGAVVDVIGEALAGDKGASRPVPREELPRILFISGLTRVLPVEIRSFSITERLFDRALVPIRAEAQVGLAVASFPSDSDDLIGQGALTYMQTLKEGQAVLNLAQAIEGAADIVPF